MDLISQLMQEHLAINALLNVIEAMALNLGTEESLEWSDIDSALNLASLMVERHHHAKEEEVLFRRLGEHPMLSQGGPKCVLFMDYQIHRNPARPIERMASEAGIEAPQRSMRPVTQKLLDAHSPLSIPLADHQTGPLALELIAHHLKAYQANQSEGPKSLIRALHAYLDLMDLHIRKEDECLFVLARSLLASSDSAAIQEEIESIEAEIGAEALKRGQDELNRLASRYVLKSGARRTAT